MDSSRARSRDWSGRPARALEGAWRSLVTRASSGNQCVRHGRLREPEPPELRASRPRHQASRPREGRGARRTAGVCGFRGACLGGPLAQRDRIFCEVPRSASRPTSPGLLERASVGFEPNEPGSLVTCPGTFRSQEHPELFTNDPARCRRGRSRQSPKPPLVAVETDRGRSQRSQLVAVETDRGSPHKSRLVAVGVDRGRSQRSRLVGVVAPRGRLREIRKLRLFSAPPSPLWVGMPGAWVGMLGAREATLPRRDNSATMPKRSRCSEPRRRAASAARRHSAAAIRRTPSRRAPRRARLQPQRRRDSAA
jgi:hypothetical protein